MNRFMQDIQDSFRRLRKSPGFAFAVIAALAIGIPILRGRSFNESDNSDETAAQRMNPILP